MSSTQILLALFLRIQVFSASLDHSYRIGFIIPRDDCCVKHIIDYALASDPANYGDDTANLTLSFEPVIIELTKDDNTYTIGQRVCEVLESTNLLAIFNMDGRVNDGFLNSMSYNLETPYIKVAQDDSHRPDKLEDSTINFHPMVDVTIYTVMKQFRWVDVVLVYRGYSGYVRMVALSKLLFKGKMKVKLIEATNEEEVHSLFKLCKEVHCNEFVVDLSLRDTERFLRVALMEGLINDNYSFLLLNLDAHHLDLSPYQHNSANISTLSLLADTPSNAAILQDMSQYFRTLGKSHMTNSLTALSILTFDAVQTFRRTMQAVSYGNNIELNRVTCDNGETLELGHTIFNYLGTTMWSGLSGSVRLERGTRQDYSINIVQLIEHHGLRKMAEYTIEDGKYREIKTPLPKKANKYKTLRVTAIIEEPFLMLAPNQEKLKGNDRYIGFCADLISLIAQDLQFTYEIVVCQNCTYGAPDDHGNWDGMVGEVINQRADLALGSFTINYKREKVIDLTKPFMHVGISILYKVPDKKTPGLFSFLEPLAIETWFYIIIAYIIVSVTLFALGRFSPQEHVKRRIKDVADGKETVVKEFRLTLADGFWFSVGTLMQQGSEVAPLAISTRTVGGFWWLFSLFVISSYTANLAAFLTVEKTVPPIHNARDLSEQTEIEYGPLINGSTYLFFKESNIEKYQRMWEYMSTHRHVFVNTYDEGVQRVKAGGYALLMESATLDYKVQKNCDTLMQIGGLLDSKGYGIGTQRASPWRDRISGAILKIQESGQINGMYEKWWKRVGTCASGAASDHNAANPLDLNNIGGIFIVLVIGLAVGFIAAVFENVYKRRITGSKEFFFKPCLCGHRAHHVKMNNNTGVSGSLAVQSESSCEDPPTDKDADSSDSLITSKQNKGGSKSEKHASANHHLNGSCKQRPE